MVLVEREVGLSIQRTRKKQQFASHPLQALDLSVCCFHSLACSTAFGTHASFGFAAALRDSEAQELHCSVLGWLCALYIKKRCTGQPRFRKLRPC